MAMMPHGGSRTPSVQGSARGDMVPPGRRDVAASSGRALAPAHGGGGGGRASRHEHGGAMNPFEGGLFGGRDPFTEFGQMDPFRGGMMGGGGLLDNFGPGFGGNIAKQFDEMQRMMGGADGSRGGAGMMNMGDGQYACQSFSMCSRMGPDGKMHTEKFVNSEVGNRSKSIREANQAYSNSSTGIDKTGHERQMGQQGMKVVRERNRHSQEERTTELFKGMDESGRSDFDSRWGPQRQHLPPHQQMNLQALAAGAPSGGRAALGSSGQGGGRQPGSQVARRR